jgi:pimeloyl-ACP methyl ester carboxylesterase
MRTASVEVAGLHIAVSYSGDPTRPALLLLHGWPHCRDLFDPVIDELGKDHFVLAPDLPGVGDSVGLPDSAEKTRLADLMLTAAEALGADRPVVAGLDVGGMVAFAAARDHAARVTGTVVMNTALPGIEPWDKLMADPRIWHFAFHTIPTLPEQLVAGHQRAYFDYFFDALAGTPDAITPAWRDRFARAYARPESLKAGFDWYRAMPDDASHNARPTAIATPMLYLRGDAGADAAAMKTYTRGLAAKGVRHLASHRIAGAGECLPLEAGEAFVEAIRAFRRSD